MDDTAAKLRQLAAVSLAKQREAKASCKGNTGCEKVLQQVALISVFCIMLSDAASEQTYAGAQPLHSARGRGAGCLRRGASSLAYPEDLANVREQYPKDLSDSSA